MTNLRILLKYINNSIVKSCYIKQNNLIFCFKVFNKQKSFDNQSLDEYSLLSCVFENIKIVDKSNNKLDLSTLENLVVSYTEFDDGFLILYLVNKDSQSDATVILKLKFDDIQYSLID